MSLSNHKRIPLAEGVEMIVGDYTHTVGSANETLAVGGGKVYLVAINPQISGGKFDAHSLYTISTSGAITTITFTQDATITDGTFCVIFGTGN